MHLTGPFPERWKRWNVYDTIWTNKYYFSYISVLLNIPFIKSSIIWLMCILTQNCIVYNDYTSWHELISTVRAGSVSFLTLWDALQRKRNYGLTAGSGLIIRSCWLEHAAPDPERQWRRKVITVPRRVEQCKMNSQLVATPLLDFLLF